MGLVAEGAWCRCLQRKRAAVPFVQMIWTSRIEKWTNISTHCVPSTKLALQQSQQPRAQWRARKVDRWGHFPLLIHIARSFATPYQFWLVSNQECLKYLIPKVGIDANNPKTFWSQYRVRSIIGISLRSSCASNPARPFRCKNVVSPLSGDCCIYCGWRKGVYWRRVVVSDDCICLSQAFHSAVCVFEVVGDFGIWSIDKY